MFRIHGCSGGLRSGSSSASVAIRNQNCHNSATGNELATAPKAPASQIPEKPHSASIFTRYAAPAASQNRVNRWRFVNFLLRIHPQAA